MLSGFGDFGVQWLRNILAYGDDVVGVASTPHQPTDHWQARLLHTATRHGIPTFVTLQGTSLPEYDIVFSASGRLYIPMEVVEAAPLGGWNLHGSLLPRLRGHCPINWSVIRGEPCGVSIHALAKMIDRGGIVSRQITTSEQSGAVIGQVSVSGHGTILDVWRRCLEASASLFHIYWPVLRSGDVHLFPQDDLDLSVASTAPRRTPADSLFDWSWTSARIHNFVRALAPPFPAARAYVNQELLKIYSGHPVPREISAAPGTEIAYKTIATADAAYKITSFDVVLPLTN